MNTKYFFYVGGIVGVFAISYFSITDEPKSPIDLDTKEIQPIKKPQKPQQKKSIDIVYLDQESKTEQSEQVKKIKKQNTYTEKLNIKDLNNQLVDLTVDEIDKVMKQKGFHNVSATVTPSKNQKSYNYNVRKRVIYADISKQQAKKNRNNSFPPSAPTIINKPNLSTVVDTDVFHQATQIVAVDTYDDGTFENVQEIKNQQDTNNEEDKEENFIEDKTTDSDMIVPPAIGQ